MFSQVLEVIEAVKAIKRIPDEYRNRYTFFSEWDIWEYVAIMDDRTCMVCKEHEGVEFTGNRIRLIFPYLKIIDPYLIEVNQHPNCRCVLVWRGFESIEKE